MSVFLTIQLRKPGFRDRRSPPNVARNGRGAAIEPLKFAESPAQPCIPTEQIQKI